MKKDKHTGNSTSGDKRTSLPDIPKKPPFLVPEGYFEKLPLKILERVNSPKVSLWEELTAFILKPSIAIQGFMIIMVLGTGAYYFLITATEIPEVAVVQEKNEDLKEEIIINEIKRVKEEEAAKHAEEIEEQLIVEQIWEDTVSVNSILMQEDPIAATSSEEIEYLIENDIDVSFIIDELQRN